MTRTSRSHKKGIYSIPELRRSFEHMEQFVNQKVRSGESKEKLCKDVQKEWKAVFMKSLDKKSAMAFVEDRMKHGTRRRTIRKTRGGALTGSPIAGAPNDYTTRQGVYLAQGSIPTSGHLPLSGGTPSNFGSYVKYVDGGFWNPEKASTVPGFSQWPAPMKGMGSNAVMKGGNRNKSRKIRRHQGGDLLATLRNSGALLSQAFTRPIPSGAPPSVVQDMQDMWHGKAVGSSPDQIQRQPTYQIGSLFPKPVRL